MADKLTRAMNLLHNGDEMCKAHGVDASDMLLMSIAHALIDLAQTARAILAELQAQRPATITNEWDPATVALGEGE